MLFWPGNPWPKWMLKVERTNERQRTPLCWRKSSCAHVYRKKKEWKGPLLHFRWDKSVPNRSVPLLSPVTYSSNALTRWKRVVSIRITWCDDDGAAAAAASSLSFIVSLHGRRIRCRLTVSPRYFSTVAQPGSNCLFCGEDLKSVQQSKPSQPPRAWFDCAQVYQRVSQIAPPTRGPRGFIYFFWTTTITTAAKERDIISFQKDHLHAIVTYILCVLN